jgi:hypothetical protein
MTDSETIASWDRKASAAVIVLAVVVFVALRIPSATIPLERDEGAYALMAQRTLAGDVPYRDVWDHKPPGVYVAYLPAVALFGASPVAIHGTAYLADLISALFLFLLVRRLAGPVAAAFSVFVFSVLATEPTWLATAANTEHFMVPFIVASAWFLYEGVRSARVAFWFIAGALAASACWVKPVATPHFILLALIAAHRARLDSSSLRAVPRKAAWFSLGVLSVSGAVVGGLFALGAWPSFVACVLTYNREYSIALPYSDRFQLLVSALTEQAPALWSIGALALVSLADLRKDRRAITIGLWVALITAGLGVGIGGRFYPHYFLQLGPPMAAAAGIGAAIVLGACQRTFKDLSVPVAASLVAALLAAPSTIYHAHFFFVASPAEKARQMYGGNPFDVSEEIARYVARVTHRDDSVLVFGSEPQILLIAGRRSATRYVCFYPVMSEAPVAIDRQREAWAEIGQAHPRAILITNVATSLLEGPATPPYLRERVADLLQTGFTLEAVRTFDVEQGRLVYGAEARRAASLHARGAGPVVDMLLFVRS